MPNFPKILRDFLIQQGQDGYWTETNPPWHKIKWAHGVSRSFITDGARRGSNWIWIQERYTNPQAETERVVTSWAYVDVFIFACAATNNETDVGDARDRMYNMRDMISHLVSVNKTKFSPAWIGRPAEGGRPLPDSNTDPPFFVMVFPVKFQYEED